MANEKTIAFSIKILGTDKEIQNIDKLKSELKSVSESLNKADFGSAAFKTLQTQANDLTAELKKLTVENKATQKSFESLKLPIGSYNQLKTELEANIERLKQSSVGINVSAEAYEKLQKKVLEGKQSIADFDAAINLNKKSLTDVTVLIEAGVDAYNFQNNSIRENRQLLKVLNDQYVQLKKPTAEQTAQVKKLTDELKAQESAIGDNRRNVGNYKEALGQLPGALGNITQGSVRLFDTLKANPYIAIIGLIYQFINALKQNEKAAEFFERTMAGAQAVIQTIADVTVELVGKLGFLSNAFSDPVGTIKELGNIIKDNLLNRFKALGGFVESVALVFEGKWSEAAKKAGNAALQLTTGIEGLSDRIINNASASVKATEALQKIEDAERELTKQTALTNTEIERQRNLLAASNTAEEKQKIAKKIIALEKEVRDSEIKFANDRVAALQKLSEANQGNEELQQRLADSVIKQQQVLQNFYQNTRKAEKAANEDLSNDLKGVLDFKNAIVNETLDLVTKNYEKEKVINDEKYNQELVDLQSQLERKVIFYEDYNTKRQELDDKYSIISQKTEIDQLEAQILTLATFGEQSFELQKQLAEKKIQLQNDTITKEIEAEQKKVMQMKMLAEQRIENEQAVQDAQLFAANQVIALGKQVVKENSKAAMLFLVLEKATAIAEIVINLQRELAAAAANAAANPLNAITGGAAGAAQFAAAAVAAKIRAAISVGVIAAQTIGQASGKLAKGAALGNGDISDVRGGSIPNGAGEIQGPSHGGGGVKFWYNGKAYEAEGGELKTNNGKERFIFTRGVAQDPVLKRLALATHNNQGHPAAKMVGSIINQFAGGRSFGKYGRAIMADGGNLNSAFGQPLQPTIVVSASTDPAILNLISEVNEGNRMIERKLDERISRIENQKIVTPVDRITQLQSEATQTREAGLF